MELIKGKKINILYVFGGEKAQGAEIVIERLMAYNFASVNPHLVISPGKFADELVQVQKNYHIALCPWLKKLNRASTGSVRFYLRALRNYFAVSYFVLDFIRKNNIDVVHANTIVPASYLLPLVWYSRVFKPKLLWVWSDHDMKYFSTIDTIQSRLCLRSYNRTIVVSKAVKHKYGFNKRISVLYNGLDPAVFEKNNDLRETFRKQLAIPDETIVVGMAASINPDKGQLELIGVFNKLCKKSSNIHLLLTGNYADATPGYSAEVMAAIALNPRITNIGFSNDMVAFYNGCDVIINNSNQNRSESLGTTIYEAMACEKIVIASRTGGTPEIITDNRDGFLFEAENMQQLEEKLARVFKDYYSFTVLRWTARQKVKEKFNIKTMTEEYNRIITMCL